MLLYEALMYEVLLMSINVKRAGRFLSLILRHKPETIGFVLDENDWADTGELLAKINAHGHALALEGFRPPRVSKVMAFVRMRTGSVELWYELKKDSCTGLS